MPADVLLLVLDLMGTFAFALNGAVTAVRVVRLDIRPVADRMVESMRAHASQVQHATVLARPEGPIAGWYALSNNVLAPILTAETYLVSAPGVRPGR